MNKSVGYRLGADSSVYRGCVFVSKCLVFSVEMGNQFSKCHDYDTQLNGGLAEYTTVYEKGNKCSSVRLAC